MSTLLNPHGSEKIIPLLISNFELAEELRESKTLKKVPLSSRELSDLLMMGMGAYTPLKGFMNHDDWKTCCLEMKLQDGLFWPIPITLSVHQDLADSINIGEKIALVNSEKKIFATMVISEKYSFDKKLECLNIYKTIDQNHPGVEKVMKQGSINLAGNLKVLDEDHYPTTYKNLYFTPEETRILFKKMGWNSVAAFQTRNPMHRSHEYLAKIAIEICDGLLIHQVLGALKPGDIPASVRVNAINQLVKNYFVEGSVIQAGYPIEMRYAGPREALLHALFRQNFGCSHLIVGRDHAGVGDYYGPFDAHKIFDEISPNSLLIRPLKIDITFFCYKCNGMATGKSCPHTDKNRLHVSGRRLREMLTKNEGVPNEFSRPEVLKVLKEYYSQT